MTAVLVPLGRLMLLLKNLKTKCLNMKSNVRIVVTAYLLSDNIKLLHVSKSSPHHDTISIWHFLFLAQTERAGNSVYLLDRRMHRSECTWYVIRPLVPAIHCNLCVCLVPNVQIASMTLFPLFSYFLMPL